MSTREPRRSGSTLSHLAVVFAAAFAVAGCGGSGEAPKRSPADYTPTELARELAAAVRDEGDGTLKNVTCVQRTKTDWRCIGDYRMSRKLIREQMRGVDTTAFSERMWRMLIERNSGSVDYDVIVDQRDGSFIYGPPGQ